MTPPVHQVCGSCTEPRWAIDDDGTDVIVAWCPTCNCAPSADALTRPLLITDIPVAMIITKVRSGVH